MDKYGGMTVSERLWVSGLMDRFDLAVEKKDVNLLKTILKEVELSESNINAILEHLGLIKKD
jgi:hypothetical protein